MVEKLCKAVIWGDYTMKLRINESIYEIIYDYTSEEGYEENNNVEQFEGTWTDLQDYLKQMRRNGCYNIDANSICDGICESLNESKLKFNSTDYNKFKNTYMYGAGVSPENAPDDELEAAIDYLVKYLRQARNCSNYELAIYIEKELNWLKSAKTIKKKKAKGTYEIEGQIEDDIWACIDGKKNIDWDALKELRSKYKDHASLFSRIRKRILDKDMWFYE